MERLVLDTNVLVRLFRSDELQHGDAVALVREAEAGGMRMVVPDTVVSEAVFVLERNYQVARSEIKALLETFLSHGAVDCPGRDILLDALTRYAGTRLDFVDCHVAAWAAAIDAPACSFDRDLTKFRDIKVRRPRAAR
jgi:predicted nucleic acid-binding protein